MRARVAAAPTAAARRRRTRSRPRGARHVLPASVPGVHPTNAATRRRAAAEPDRWCEDETGGAARRGGVRRQPRNRRRWKVQDVTAVQSTLSVIVLVFIVFYAMTSPDQAANIFHPTWNAVVNLAHGIEPVSSTRSPPPAGAMPPRDAMELPVTTTRPATIRSCSPGCRGKWPAIALLALVVWALYHSAVWLVVVIVVVLLLVLFR